MTISLRATLCALALFLVPAAAEQADNTQFGFSAAFPCQSQSMSMPTTAHGATIQMNMFICMLDGRGYSVAIVDFPPGTTTEENRSGKLDEAAQGSAANIQGTIRSMKVYSLDGYEGREVVVDSPARSMTVRERFFAVGDRIYMAMVLVPPHEETDQTAISFLDSFHIRR